MNNQDLLYQLYLQQQQENNSLGKLKNYASKINNTGENLSTIGNVIKDNVDNEMLRKFGTSMSNMGTNLSNGANTVSNTLNTPKEYFKGFANQTVGTGLQNAGQYLADKTGMLGNLGTNLTKMGASMGGTATGASTGAATGSTAGAGAASGASAGAGAGGAATAAGTGAAAGTAGGAGATASSGLAALGPAALVGLGIMALKGTNRKRAKKQGEALMNATNQIVTQESDNALEEAQQNTLQQLEQAQNAISQGIPTGGAAPIQKESNPISDYQDYLRSSGYGESVINGVPQGLNGGHQEIADWIKQYNSGSGRNNPINIPQTPEEIAAAQQGTFNNMQQGGVTATESIKQGILDKFINGITDFSRGYQENRNTAFSPENLSNQKFTETTSNADGTTGEKTYDKSKMGRLGEFAGSLGRIAQNPSMQALIAGGLSTALTGNPLYGLGMAQKYGNARSMNNIYQDVLAKNGIEVNPGFWGNITANDMKAVIEPKYKETINNLALAKLQETQNYHDMMLKYYNDKLKETHDNNVANQQTKQTNANANMIRANNSGKKPTGNTQNTKPQNHPDWGSDLAGYAKRLSNPDYIDRVPDMKAAFIQKYGVDPDKYIKL